MGLRNPFFSDKMYQHMGTAYTVISHIPEEQIPQGLFCCKTSLTASSQDFPGYLLNARRWGKFQVTPTHPPPHTHKTCYN